jgi:hypothetical protein
MEAAAAASGAPAPSPEPEGTAACTAAAAAAASLPATAVKGSSRSPTRRNKRTKRRSPTSSQRRHFPAGGCPRCGAPSRGWTKNARIFAASTAGSSKSFSRCVHRSPPKSVLRLLQPPPATLSLSLWRHVPSSNQGSCRSRRWSQARHRSAARYNRRCSSHAECSITATAVGCRRAPPAESEPHSRPN